MWHKVDKVAKPAIAPPSPNFFALEPGLPQSSDMSHIYGK